MNRTMRSLARLFLALGLVGAGACIVSPQPSPPGGPSLDAGLIGGDSIEVALTGIVVRGSAGAVDPPGGTVVITNLDTTDAPSVAPVADDGSFEILVPGEPGNELRLIATNDDGRSEPVDLEYELTGLSLSTRPLADCLVLEPALSISLDGSGDARSIVIQNDCDALVSLAPPRLRRGMAGFTFAPTTGFDLAPGDATTVTVRAGAGAETEDVLFLEATAEGDRRPISLFVPD